MPAFAGMTRKSIGSFIMTHLISAGEEKSGLVELLSVTTEPYRMGLFELELEPGAHWDLFFSGEQVAVLLEGKATVFCEEEEFIAERASPFDEDVWCVHTSANVPLKIAAQTSCKWLVIQTPNNYQFPSRIIDKNSLVDHEHRGKGTLNDTSHRIVRTFFDSRNSSHSHLVVGEVVNFGGKWSSYPPHHHPQPEIYHYRFDDKRGYGHGEVGDQVYKVRDGDTLLIPPGLDHAQVSAPGYQMYYLWAIRQTLDEPYTKPTFASEHAWLLREEPKS
jgi:5-deoxy-glucuronate isomerase